MSNCFIRNSSGFNRLTVNLDRHNDAISGSEPGPSTRCSSLLVDIIFLTLWT